MKRKTEKDYYKLAECHQFKWIGGILPKNVRTKTWWKCSKGHEWESKYNDICSNYGCPYCAHVVRKVESDYYALALKHNLEWVGVLPKNTRCKTKWRCKKGHEWFATYSNLGGCPICLKKIKEDYIMLAKKRGFEWIGDFPKNSNTKTLWKCVKCGKVLALSYSSVYKGKGCKVYFMHVKKTEKDYKSLARIRGFKWIDKKVPKNIQTKTLWKCKKGHIWKACYNNVRYGTGCPYCKDFINGAPVSKPQHKLNLILYGILNYPESKYRIDVAIMRKSQKIAVEYDCCYWHKGKEKHDAKRDKYLISKGWKILHVKSEYLIPTRKQLKEAINCLLKRDNIIYSLYLNDWKLL